MTMDIERPKAEPIKTGQTSSLNIGEAVSVLISERREQISSNIVPFRPKAGEVYLYKPDKDVQKVYHFLGL